MKRLIELVELGIQTAPYEHDGFIWAVVDQGELAHEIGIDERHLRRFTSNPPFDKDRILIGDRIFTALRIGESVMTPRRIAKKMSRAFSKKTKRQHTKSHFGILVELAVYWGEDAPPIFQAVLDDWQQYMALVKIAAEEAENVGHPSSTFFMKFPCIPILKGNRDEAEEVFITKLQEAGKTHELSPAMRLKYPYLVVPKKAA
jgi:hypothetical protein